MTISISFILPDGEVRKVQAPLAENLMRVALGAGVEGIAGDCGGDCSCATCHVYIDDAFGPLLDPPSAIENDMLEGTASERRPGSRLACQLRLTDAMEGLRIELPERQF